MKTIWYDVSCKKRDILAMLDLTIWNFDFSGFNAEVEGVIFIYLQFDTNHLWVIWNKTIFSSLFYVLTFNTSHLPTEPIVEIFSI